MIGQFHHRGWHYVVLTAVAGLVFFLNLGGATLWDRDEGRNAPCSMEMMESGNWIVPTFNGKLRVDKPALLYWMQIFSYRALGVNELAARFPSAMAALLTVFLCYELSRSLFSRTTGLLAGLIVATTPMMCGAARFANPDSLLNACTVLALTLFWLGHTARPTWWFVALGASLGLAMLAKGPVGLVLPSAVVFLFYAWQHQLKVYLDWRWLWTALAFTLVGIPWYVWVGLETHGEFLHGFFWRHNLERGLSPMEDHYGFPGFYIAVLFGGTAPWSIFLGLSWWYGFWSAVQNPWKRFNAWWAHAAEQGEPASASRPTQLDTPAAYRFLLCWLFAYFFFFSVVATKLPNYILPAIVPCAILIARFLQRWRTGSLQLPMAWAYATALGLTLIGLILIVGLGIISGIVELPKMHNQLISELRPWTLVGLVPLAASAVGAWFVKRRQYSGYIVTVAIGAILILGPGIAYVSAIFNHYKAPQPLVEEAHALRPNDDIRIGCWQFENLPSLNFYVKRNVVHLYEPVEIPNFLGSPVPVYLFTWREDWEQSGPAIQKLGRVVATHYDFYRRKDVVVVTNRLAEF